MTNRTKYNRPTQCKQWTEHKIIRFGIHLGGSYHICNKPIKYKIRRRNGVTGEIEILYVCGRHYQSYLKASLRLKKRCDFDDDFIVLKTY